MDEIHTSDHQPIQEMSPEMASSYFALKNRVDDSLHPSVIFGNHLLELFLYVVTVMTNNKVRLGFLWVPHGGSFWVYCMLSRTSLVASK